MTTWRRRMQVTWPSAHGATSTSEQAWMWGRTLERAGSHAGGATLATSTSRWPHRRPPTWGHLLIAWTGHLVRSRDLDAHAWVIYPLGVLGRKSEPCGLATSTTRK
jgi:hypothetical protein